jgi:hypothetical protein
MDDYDSLRICENCGSGLCFESAAEPLTPEIWLVVVQCPNCWSAWRRAVSDAAMELFERALDGDRLLIEAAAEQLAYENERWKAERLAAEVAAFAAALDAGAIQPMDF